MGISTKPTTNWCEWDNPAFPAGKTPKEIIVTITGVNRGTGALYGPYCGTFRCVQISSTQWEYRDPTPDPGFASPPPYRVCQYFMDGYNTYVYYVFYYYYSYPYGWSGSVFAKGFSSPCVIAGINGYQDPTDYFYGGSFNAVWVGDGNTPDSLAADSVLSGMEASDKDLYEPAGAEASAIGLRFARRRDKSCIYVKKEF